MSAWRNVALAVVVWSGLASPAKAIPLSWISSSSSQGWSVWSNGSRVTTTAPAPSPPPPVFNPAPIASSSPAPAVAETPAVFAKATPSGLVPASTYYGRPDAFLNFGNGAYADADMLVTGAIRPWYESPSVTKVFGGTPDAAQQQAFTSNVLNMVQDTFARSGLYPKLTLDPTASADHTMSVVSGAAFVNNANAIGITNVGYNGFGFIDKLSYAKSPEELARAVASNLSHELMHAFGVGSHPDSTGQYLDSATATWDMLTNPNVSFSQEAVQDLLRDQPDFNPEAAKSLSAQVLTDENDECTCQSCQVLGTQLIAPSPVPEPGTVMIWAAGSILIHGLARRYRTLRRAS